MTGSWWQMLPLDEDGTPLAGGERMVEVKPGVWTTPTTLALEKYLADKLPRTCCTHPGTGLCMCDCHEDDGQVTP